MNQSNAQNQADDQLDLIARTVAEHTELLEKHTVQLDKITPTVVGHTERFDRIEEKLESVVIREDHQEVMDALDTIIKLAKKKDEELTMMSHGIQRLGKDIDKIKPLVGLT